MSCNELRRQRIPEGFTLVEVVLALGLFVFAALAVFGLFATAMNSEREAAFTQAANNLVASVHSGLVGAVPTDNGMVQALPPVEGMTWSLEDGVREQLTFDEFSVLVNVGQVERVGGEKSASVTIAIAWPSETTTWNEEGKAIGAAGSFANQSFILLP